MYKPPPDTGLTTAEMLQAIKVGHMLTQKEAGGFVASLLSKIGLKGVSRLKPGFFATLGSRVKGLHYGRKATNAFAKAQKLAPGSAKYETLMSNIKNYQRYGRHYNRIAKRGPRMARLLGSGVRPKALLGAAGGYIGWTGLNNALEAKENLQKYRNGLDQYYNNMYS